MSTLTACRGWSNPNSDYYLPIISSLSAYSSPVGITALIVIFGQNFKQFSAIKFGIYTPITYFVSSEQISFYVSDTYLPGIYPVQVFNDSSSSNVINYTIDAALVGYWTGDNGAITGHDTLDITGAITGQSTLDITGAITGQSTLDITGAATAASFTQTSDYRIKDVIEPLNSSYSVSNLKPIKYLNNITKREDIGFLAHEVQDVFPCLVTGEKDGDKNQTINYIGLIGVLVQEIQQLKADILLLKR